MAYLNSEFGLFSPEPPGHPVLHYKSTFFCANSKDPPFFRTLSLAYLPVFAAVHFLFAPTNLCYDWQMGAIPLVKSWVDPRVAMMAAFYGLVAAFVFRICRRISKVT